jgi:hypothetical protein
MRNDNEYRDGILTALVFAASGFFLVAIMCDLPAKILCCAIGGVFLFLAINIPDDD